MYEIRQNHFATQSTAVDLQTKPNEMLFSDLLKIWMENNYIRHKASTNDKYSYLICRHIIPELGNIALSQLSPIRINSFLLSKLEQGRTDHDGGLSPSYVRSMMLIINSAYNYAVQEQFCPPLRTPIYKPPIEKKDIQILDSDLQKKIEEYILRNLSLDGLGVLVSLYTGLRIGEICALSWQDIDFKRQILHVRHTIMRSQTVSKSNPRKSSLSISSPKTSTSIRDIPISSKIFPLLSEMKSKSTSEYVISQKNAFVCPRTYEYRFHKILESGHFKKFNYHVLRHTFATRCVEAGMDVKTLSEILGHANTNITLNIYVHSSMEMKRVQIEKLTNKL